MAKKKDIKKFGHYAFMAGVVLAIVLAFIPQLKGDVTIWILVVLGVIVGLLDITHKETHAFLVASVTLIIASSAISLTLASIWIGLTAILANIIVFVAPAAIVVALKTVYVLAED